jgi:AcrR family transcriptional regulator
MVTKNEPVDDLPTEDAVSWREQAVARSLDTARTRAENRVQRFMGAALELITPGSGKDFTVQEVVERSGQSLRSFYQHFEGKHELLLALFEESVTSTVRFLGEKIAQESDPLERLHRFVVEYYEVCRPSSGRKPAKDGSPPVMAEFAQQLLTQHPKEAAKAFVPIVSMFSELLDQANAVDGLRSDLPTKRVAGVVLEAVMFNAFSSTISGASNKDNEGSAAEELWDLFWRGIGNPTRA